MKHRYYNYDKPGAVTGDAKKAHMAPAGENMELDDNTSHERLVGESPGHSTSSDNVSPQHPRHILRFWVTEIASMLVAGGFMAAIWIIIARYDGKPIPEWPLAINLSALVSILAVGFRLAVISPVSAVMGQQKWPWMLREPRPLHDLQRMDSASTSTLGAFELLLKGPRSPMVMLGAATVLLALAVGPVAQQAIRSVPCRQDDPSGLASVPVANYFDPGSLPTGGRNTYTLTPEGKGAMVDALVNPQGNGSAVSATCSTGNCDFHQHNGATYASLGLCHSCLDTTALIVYDPGNGTRSESFTWADGSSAGTNALLSRGFKNVSLDRPPFTSEFANIANNSFTTFNILTVQRDPSRGGSFGKHLAVSCALYPCIRRYHGEVKDGRLDETLVSTSTLTKILYKNTVPSQTNYTAIEVPCMIDNQLYDTSNFSMLDRGKYRFLDVTMKDGSIVSAPFECVYGFPNDYAGALSTYLCAYGADEPCFFNGGCEFPGGSPTLICDPSFWLARFWRGDSTDYTIINDTVSQFAVAVSNYIRTSGTSLYSESTSGPPRQSSSPNLAVVRHAPGVAYTTTLCVSFAWEWLLWPLVLYGVAVGLLLISVIRPYLDQTQPIWKSSPLPLLFFTMEKPVAVTTLMNEKQLDKQAGRMRVQFGQEGELGVVRLA